MSREFTISTKPYDDFRLYNKKTFTIQQGLTILTGCNGAGKTTMLNHIRTELDKNNIPCFYFDNYHEGGRMAASKAMFFGQVNLAATLFCSSEGEKISRNIEQTAAQIGNFVRKNQDKYEIWLLFDALDSGYSIDNIIETKTDLFQTIIKDCKYRNVEVYIVVSANSYEMASGEQCLDVWSGKYITFEDYEDYKSYILKTRERKNNRVYSKKRTKREGKKYDR